MSQTRSASGASVLVERTAGLTAFIGAFVMISTAVFTITGNMGISNVLVGALTATLASIQAYRTGTTRSPSIVLAVIIAVIGVWIAISPSFVFDVERGLVLGINGVAGALVVILSLAGVYGSFRTPDTAATSA